MIDDYDMRFKANLLKLKHKKIWECPDCGYSQPATLQDKAIECEQCGLSLCPIVEWKVYFEGRNYMQAWAEVQQKEKKKYNKPPTTNTSHKNLLHFN